MEVNPSIPMEKASKIIRRSIHIYLKSYHYFTSTTSLIIFPVSIAILLSQAIIPSSSHLLPTIYTHFQSVFYALGFPESSMFFSILYIKLSQTICSIIFTLPFTLSFLLLAKSSIIKALHYQNPSLPPSISSVFHLSYPLLLTHLCNSFIILAANASALTLLSFIFTSMGFFGYSSPNFLLFFASIGVVLYSIILANTLITCNLAMIVSGMDNCSGFSAIIKAYVLIQGRNSTALLLALPFNLAMASVEALFHYRVVQLSLLSDRFSSLMALEGLVIAFLYSILIVLDTITTCEFFKSCESNIRLNIEDKYYHLLHLLPEKNYEFFESSKNLDQLP